MNKKNRIFHEIFELGITIKLINGILEILGGILLLYFDPTRLNKLIVLLTQHELLEDPNDVVANFLVNMSHKFSLSTEYFGVFYLLFHGILKIIIYILLIKGRNKAHLVAIIGLFLFIIYQVYRLILSLSPIMILLTVFDILILIFTIIDYKHILNEDNEGV